MIGNSQVLAATAAGCWVVASGATAPAANLITFIGSGCADVKFDALGNRLAVATYGLNRVDLYNLATNAFISSPLITPQLQIVDSVEFDDDRRFTPFRASLRRSAASPTECERVTTTSSSRWVRRTVLGRRRLHTEHGQRQQRQQSLHRAH